VEHFNAGEGRKLFIMSDTTDTNGVRHVELQTTVTGNSRRGYEAAERQAKEWFFLHYDPSMKESELDHSAGAIRSAFQSGHLDPAWFEYSHPTVVSGEKQFMFVHRFGINPQTALARWTIEFEILPLER